MKRLYSRHLVIVFLLCEIICGCKSSQNNNLNSGKNKSIIIKIAASDVIKTNKQITVVVFSELQNPLYTDQGNYNEYIIDLSKGVKTIKVEIPTEVAYIKFFNCSNEFNGKPLMIEGGDSCELNISNNNYSLSFGNKESLALQEEIFNIPVNFFQGRDYTKPDYNASFIHFSDSIALVINSITRKYTQKMPAKLLHLIKTNTLSRINLIYINIIFNLPSNLPKENYQAITPYIEKLVSDFKNKKDFEIRNSYNYAAYGIKLLRTYCLFKERNSIEDAFYNTFQMIVNNYSGLLRDKMLCILFNSKSHTDKWNNLIKKAVIVIQDSTYKSSLISLVSSSKVGSRAYEFNLLSDNRRIYTLDDFKGNIIVCHLWFNGCSGCIMLSKAFKSLEQKYKGTKDVVFANINVDADTAKWKKGLASKLYTGASEINLNIGKMGSSDEMLKYYGYFGYPQILLIDKLGNIISTNPYIASYTKEGLKHIDSLISQYTQKEDKTESSF